MGWEGLTCEYFQNLLLGFWIFMEILGMLKKNRTDFHICSRRLTHEIRLFYSKICNEYTKKRTLT